MNVNARLNELAQGMPRGWQARLARHCGVKPPSVSDWVSGNTKQIDAPNLLKIAEFFQCSFEWLATGHGNKFPPSNDGTPRVMERRASYGKASLWPFKEISPAQWDILTEAEQSHVENTALLLLNSKQNKALPAIPKVA